MMPGWSGFTRMQKRSEQCLSVRKICWRNRWICTGVFVLSGQTISCSKYSRLTCSEKRKFPFRGGTCPERVFRRVDLPIPLKPVITTFSPPFMVKSISCRMGWRQPADRRFTGSCSVFLSFVIPWMHTSEKRGCILVYWHLVKEIVFEYNKVSRGLLRGI